jgi:hypothetical protein
MLRHNHVTQYPEVMTRPHLVKYLDKQIPILWRSQQGKPPVTTESQKMEIASSVNAPEGIA